MRLWLGRMQFLYSSISKAAFGCESVDIYELRKTSEDPSEKMCLIKEASGASEEKTREKGPSRAH
jgi:hypothetical protein